MNAATYPEQVFMPVESGRASEDIALKLEAAILDGRLVPGERLPSERDMQVQFGTGRGVVREALKLLKQKGLLEVRKGVKGGAYIRRLDVSNISESLALFLKQHPVEPEKLIEFRETLDLEGALRLEALLRQDEPDLGIAGELDRELNIMLARMAGNPLFEWVMNALQMGFSSHDVALYQDPHFREKAGANWSATARAIAEGEPLRALSFIARHYALLRQCAEEKNILPAGAQVPFLKDTGRQPDGESE